MGSIKIQSVRDLLENIDLVPDEEPAYVFRGESQEYEKPCTPSLFRDYSAANSVEFDGGVNQEYLRVKKWQEEVELSEGGYLPCRTDLEVMIYARHYGVLTSLLDWSSNPLASLWFAAADSRESDGCIFTHQIMLLSVDSLRVSLRSDEESDRFNALGLNPFCRKMPASNSQNTPELSPFTETHFYRPRSLPSTRVLSQSGLISIHPNPDPSNVYQANKRFVVPSADKKSIVRELAVLGISERALGLSTRDDIGKRLNTSRYPWN